MTDRYSGPATLRTDNGHTFDVEATVATHVDDYQIRSWEGRVTTTDLRVMSAALPTANRCTLTLPGGREGDVHVVHVELRPDQPGVLLRLHGSGPAPY